MYSLELWISLTNPEIKDSSEWGREKISLSKKYSVVPLHFSWFYRAKKV